MVDHNMGKCLFDFDEFHIHRILIQFIPQASHTRIGILYTKYEKSIDW